MGTSAVPVANPTVVLREEFDDWAVLYNPDTAAAVGMNPVGVAIWKLIDGSRAPETIASQVTAQFANAVEESVRADTVDFIKSLAEQGFVGYERNATV